MNGGKGNIILLTIIAVATLLVAVAGTTFAYFSATMNNNQSPKTIEVTNGTLFVEYDSSSQIKGIDSPSANTELGKKEFTITGYITGSSNLNYETKLNIKNNTYADGELVYVLTSNNESNNGSTIPATKEVVSIPSGTSVINLGKGIFAGPVANGAKHSYTLTIKYVNEKGDSANKTFEADLSVGQMTN